MNEGHLERILRDNGGQEILDTLAGKLSPTDLQSLLLEVYRRRVHRVSPAQIRAQYARSRFARPSPVDPRIALKLEATAFDLARGFEPIEISPVCPLGTVSVLGDVSQDWVVPTARNTEVVADPTNCLALECAARREAGAEPVRLCTSHRVMRTQTFSGPLSFAHFRLFALCTAGRDAGSYAFECSALAEHLRFHVAFLLALEKFARIRVRLTAWDAALQGAFADHVGDLPNVAIDFNPDRQGGRGYYDRFCFEVLATDSKGEEHSLCDGGVTDWTAKLLANQRERLVISGMGLERVCLLFGS